jgi:D-glutamate cyclase-like, C-terminal
MLDQIEVVKMLALSNRVEELILQHGSRGMDRLRYHLKPGYCWRAAQLLVNHPGVVLLGTGFPVAGTFESDGPIGAIALYHILQEIGSKPVFVCAPPISRVMSRSFLTFELPIAGWDESRTAVNEAVKELTPSLVVAVERAGKAADGRYYNMRGVDISRSTAKYDLFFEQAGCPGIAFGDGGNEIGMGNLHHVLSGMNIVPSVTTCDELVISTVSNWGVYGVIAMLCKRLRRDLFAQVDPAAIAGYLLANGCVDGVTSRQELTEDGFPIQVGISIIEQLKQLLWPQAPA